MKWTNKGHQYDEIGKHFVNVNRIYLYGASDRGIEALQQLSFTDIPIIFIDRSDEKQNQGFQGHKVISPAQFYREYNDIKSIVILTMDSYLRAKRNLLSMGLRDGIEVFDWKFFNEFYIHIYAMYRHEKLHITFTCEWITNKCTLTCKNCVQFIDILPEISKTYEQVVNDIDTLFSTVDYLGTMYMQGGELTLHANCVDLINYVLDNYSSRFVDFYIFTNGVWPKSLERKSFFKALTRPKAHIYWSDYSENVNDNIRAKIHENIESARQHGVDVLRFVPHWIDIGDGNFEEHSEDWHIDRFNDCQVNFNAHDNKVARCTQSYEWAQRVFGDDYLTHIEEDWIYLKFDDYTKAISDSDREKDKKLMHKRIMLETYLGYTESGYTEMCAYCRGWLGVNNTSIPAGVQRKRKCPK